MGAQVRRDLPNDEYLAAINANAPTAGNPYATIADLTGGNGIYGGSDVLTGNTEAGLGIYDLNFGLSDNNGRFSVGPTGFVASRNIHFKCLNGNGFRVQGADDLANSEAFEIVNNSGDFIALFQNDQDIALAPEIGVTTRARVTIGSQTVLSNARLTVHGGSTSSGGVCALFVNSAGTTVLQVQNSVNVGVAAMGSAVQRFNVRGFGDTSASWGIVHEDINGVELNRFRDDGRTELTLTGGITFMGNQASNYFKQDGHFTTQFSSTATYSGFHADRNGNGISMWGSSVTRQGFRSTGTMVFEVDWNNNINTAGTYAMHIWESTQNVGIGLASATVAPASKLTVAGGDIEVEGSANGMILESPDASRWRVTVNNAGALVVAAA